MEPEYFCGAVGVDAKTARAQNETRLRINVEDDWRAVQKTTPLTTGKLFTM
jgi:hypothetical protein